MQREYVCILKTMEFKYVYIELANYKTNVLKKNSIRFNIFQLYLNDLKNTVAL